MQTGARLWLVRHGETDWNVAGRVQGHTPTELNAAGFGQARRLAGFLKARVEKGGTFGGIWASDLPRAYQTAEAIGAALHLPVERTAELRERSFGEYEGATAAEVNAARARLGLKASGDLADWTGVPGIETNDGLWARVAGALRRIATGRDGEDLLVVTHGGVVARAVYRTLGLVDGTARRFPLSNGLVVVLQWREAIAGWYLLSLVDMGLVMGGDQERDTSAVSVKDSKGS